ncbi:MAG: MFS transporter [Chloroflexaceae bacterium]|nr:MFS transporter [Chloroflexaceae bacterium]
MSQSAPQSAPAAQFAPAAPILILLAYLAFISLGLPDALLGVAWPSISAEFGLPIGYLGLLLACASVGYLMASFAGGWLIARLGIGPLLTVSCLLAMASLIGYATVPMGWLLFITSYFLGMGGGAIDVGLNIYAAAHFSPRHVNWLHACYGVGAMLGPLIVTAVLSAGLVWRWAYLLTAGLLALMSLAFWFSRHLWDQPTAPAPDAPASLPSPPTVGTSLRRPLVWFSIALFFIYTGLEITAGQWSYTLLTEGRGMDPTQAGVWIGLYWGSLTVGRIVFGIISERVAPDAILRLCTLGLLASTLLIWQSEITLLNSIGLALTGFLLAPIFPLMIARTPARIGAAAPYVISFQVAAASIGAGTIPAATGWLVEQLGLEAVGGVIGGLALGVVLLHEAVLLLGSARATTPVPEQ